MRALVQRALSTTVRVYETRRQISMLDTAAGFALFSCQAIRVIDWNLVPKRNSLKISNDNFATVKINLSFDIIKKGKL